MRELRLGFDPPRVGLLPPPVRAWTMFLYPIGRGGPIVTVGGALLFLWMAISGRRPNHRFPGESQTFVVISVAERLGWTALALALIGYELLKFRNSFLFKH